MSVRTGLLPFWKNYDRKLYLKAAILADELGYDSFWIPEAWGYEIFSLLTEIAVHTKQIKIGTGIVNCFSRSPGLLAMNAATVDEISEGRLILGLGTSGKRVIEGFHAREFSKPLTQLRDVIRVTKTLLSGKPLHESGAKLHDYRPFELAMKSAARRRPDLRRRAQAEIDHVDRRARRWLDPDVLALHKLEQGHCVDRGRRRQVGPRRERHRDGPVHHGHPARATLESKRPGRSSPSTSAAWATTTRSCSPVSATADECKRVDELYRDKTDPVAGGRRGLGRDDRGAHDRGRPQALHFRAETPARVRDRPSDPEPAAPIVPWEMTEMFIRTMAPSSLGFLASTRLLLPWRRAEGTPRHRAYAQPGRGLVCTLLSALRVQRLRRELDSTERQCGCPESTRSEHELAGRRHESDSLRTQGRLHPPVGGDGGADRRSTWTGR